MAISNIVPHPGAAPEPAHLRAQRLLTEARQAADEQIRLLEQALVAVGRLSSEVSEGGEVYPPGVRDIAKRISGDAAWCAQTLDVIMTHAAGRRPPPELNLI